MLKIDKIDAFGSNLIIYEPVEPILSSLSPHRTEQHFLTEYRCCPGYARVNKSSGCPKGKYSPEAESCKVNFSRRTLGSEIQ